MRRRGIASVAVVSALAWFAMGCAPVPRPSILSQVDQVGQGAAAADARTYAPGAFAAAENLRKEAGRTFDAGDIAGAQIIAERALAAYAHAEALARIARAETGADAAQNKLTAAKKELAAIDAEQTKVAAEADAFELKIRVARDAQPIQPSGKTDAERERARVAAARALALQARLLCAGARLLQGNAPPTQAGSQASPGPQAGSQASPGPAPDGKLAAQLDEATAALAKLEAQLGPTATLAPIDEATRVRAGCLAALTAIRRAGTPVTRAPGAGDALLAEISAMGSLSPSRDDRGVYITLRGLFGDGGGKGLPSLSPQGEARVAEIGRIAGAHPAFPVEVIIHHDKALGPKDEPSQRARADAVAKALVKAAPGAKIESIVAGNAAPIVDPGGADRARNARIEIVFVTPESF